MDVQKFVVALRRLEGEYGSNPSTKEIAEYIGCSEATAIKYLQRAVGEGLIAQRNGKYMSLEIARAYDAQKG